MSWQIFLNFIAAFAIVPPILKWLFIKNYRIELRRKNYEANALQLSKYIKSTYKQREYKEPAELQAETDTLLVSSKLSYRVVFFALDSKIIRIFDFLKNIQYAEKFIDINSDNGIVTFRSKLSKKQIKYFFNSTFGLHIIATVFWAGSYFFIDKTVFGLPKELVFTIILCTTALLVRFSTQAKTVELINKDVTVEFPS